MDKADPKYWPAELVALHVGADLVISFCYFCIPLIIVWYSLRRRDLGLQPLFWCFAIFVFGRSLLHLYKVWNMWHGHYWQEGFYKALTSLASLACVYLLLRLLPQALGIPSREELEREIQQRKEAEDRLRETNLNLEARVQERMAEVAARSIELARRSEELEQANQSLQAEIAARQRAQQEESRLAAIVDNSQDAIFSTDLKGHVISWNPSAERTYGFSAAEIFGQSFGILFAPTQQSEWIELCGRMERDENVHQFQTVQRCKDGTLLDVSVTVSPVRNPEKKVIGMSMIVRDERERIQQDRALRASEARERARRVELETLIESLPAPIWISRDAECREIIGNRASYDILGLKPGTNVSSSAWPSRQSTYQVLIGGKSVAPSDHPMQRACRERQPVLNTEVEIRWPDGTARFMYGSAVPLTDPTGSIVGCLGAFVEITELKRAEQVILDLNNQLENRVQERTAALEAANRELEAFSYSVSHDLQAPLRAIDGFSEALMIDCAPHLPESGRRDLQIIRESARNMSALVRDLLLLAQTAREPIVTAEIEMNQTIAEAWQAVRSVRNGSSPKWICPPVPSAQGDERLIRQVWINLLDNASKYTSHRPDACIEISAEREPEGTTYRVRDNGAGFDMRYAHKLFGVFQRLHRADEFEGTGVGLALVHRIIERHGGRVWARGAVNEGSEFSFFLPDRSAS